MVLVHITSLVIDLYTLKSGTLIDLLQYLPNLDSFAVDSLEIVKPECLSERKAETLRLVSKNNKITKVNLRQMTTLEQAQFIRDLCPRMQYLETNCTNACHAEWLLRFILMNHIDYIPNLFSLYLRISNPNEEMLEKIKTIFELEQQPYNPMIKLVNNGIHVKWNL